MSTTTNSSTRPKWKVQKRTAEDLVEHLCLIRSLTADELDLDYEKHLHDPFLLPDMREACEVLSEIKKNLQAVTIFGDYDADGTPAAALLSIAFDALGIKHSVVLPTRETGYGLRLQDVEAAAKHSKLLITVDTGITAVAEIKRAKELGMRAIILDHHLPKEELPPADAVVDPFVAHSKYPFPNLCGCALAYKFVVALSTYFPEQLNEAFRKWLLDLVAVSTVADMMVMKNENRALVHYGLIVLRNNRRLGFRELLRSAGIEAETVDAGTLGFALGPRLNASGRLGDNRIVYELLTTKDPAVARELAEKIERVNRERQTMVEQLLAITEKVLFKQNDPSDKFLVVSGENWPSGILGLAAGKIAGQYNRPTIVLSKNGSTLTGSGRSPENYSLIDGLTNQANLLTRFGGHRTAAGLALDETNFSKFVDNLKAQASTQISDEDLLQSFAADAIIKPEEITLETVNRIKKLAPFGMQNPEPQLIIQNIAIDPLKRIGRQQNHIKTTGRIGESRFDIVGFNLAKLHDEFGDLSEIDCLGNLEVNNWNGRRTLQFRLADYHPTGKNIIEI